MAATQGKRATEHSRRGVDRGERKGQSKERRQRDTDEKAPNQGPDQPAQGPPVEQYLGSYLIEIAYQLHEYPKSGQLDIAHGEKEQHKAEHQQLAPAETERVPPCGDLVPHDRPVDRNENRRVTEEQDDGRKVRDPII